MLVLWVFEDIVLEKPHKIKLFEFSVFLFPNLSIQKFYFLLLINFHLVEAAYNPLSSTPILQKWYQVII